MNNTSQFIDQWKSSGRKINHAPYDITKGIITGAPVGLIQSIGCFETNPNEKFQVDVQGLLRSETLNTAAFAKGTLVANAFFVPYCQIWHNFNMFVVQKEDRHSAAYRDTRNVPVFHLLSWERYLAMQFALAKCYELYVSDPLGKLNVLRAKDIDSFNQRSAIDGWLGGITNTDYCNDDQYSLDADMHGYPLVYNFLRSFQYFKYGNLYWLEDVWRRERSSPAYTDLASFFGYLQNSIDDYLVVVEQILVKDNGKYLNLFRPCAYQHIWYDYYRNQYMDDTPFINTVNKDLRYIDTFNLDDISCDTFSGSVVAFSAENGSDSYDDFDCQRLKAIMCLHYHKYKNDIFTTAMPTTQFGAVSQVEAISPELKFNYFGVVKDVDFDNQGIQIEDVYDNFTIGNNDVLDETFHLPSFFDVLNLRRAELMQQWKQNALRAGNKVRDNFRQHYGVDSYYEDSNEVRLLGSWKADFNINPVTATASTGGSVNGNVGDLAAIGVGTFQGNKVTFEVNDFGVVMFNVYFLPETIYSANGIDKANTLVDPFDFYSEEFENIGMESLPWYIQNAQDKRLVKSNLGYVPPYTMYKTNIDEAFGQFSCVDFYNYEYDAVHTWHGSMLPWSSQRQDTPSVEVNGEYARDRSAFYVNPSVFNPLFAIEYDGSTQTEPFSLAINLDVKALRPMSVLGLPIFG